MNKQYCFEGLSLAETKEIFKKYRLGEISINELVISNIGLVKKIIFRTFQNCQFDNFEYDDLIQEGCISLYKSILNYDENKDYKFSTYSYNIIRNDLVNVYFKNMNMVSSSKKSIEKSKEIQKFIADYNVKNKKNPTIEEIAKSFNTSVESILSLYNLGLTETRLEKLVYNSDDDSEEIKYFMTNNNDVEKEIMCIFLKKEMMNLINELDEKSKNLILYRYGFIDGICHSFVEIAKQKGISRQAVEQKEKRVFEKCKKLCLKKGLQEFLK